MSSRSSFVERVGRHVGRVRQLLLQAEVLDHRLEVGVGRERAEVAQRRELAQHVARGAEHEEAEERQSLLLVEPSGDAEVEERGAPVGHREQVPAVQVAVEHAVEQRALEERDQARPQQRVRCRCPLASCPRRPRS